MLCFITFKGARTLESDTSDAGEVGFGLVSASTFASPPFVMKEQTQTCHRSPKLFVRI